MTAALDEHTDRTLAAVARFNEAFDRHDVESLMAAMTDDCVFENTGPAPNGERYEGAAAVRAFWAAFFAANPDARFTVEDQFAGGDRCVVRWRYDWAPAAPPDPPHHVRGVDVFRVRDGLVSEKLAYVKG
jgi:ketosteroid isomerase-like protein